VVGQVDVEEIAAQWLIDVIDARADVYTLERIYGAKERPKVEIDSSSGKIGPETTAPSRVSRAVCERVCH
jgi:hypothetical protein